MSFGKMNQTITLLTPYVITDDEGFTSKELRAVATVRAYREGRHGSSAWANREIAGRYGGLDHLGDKLMKSENYEQAIEEVIWLICLLANQDVAIWNLGHPDGEELSTEVV